MISHCFKSTHQVGDQNLPDGPSKSNDMHVLVDFWDCYYDIPSPEITLQLPTLNSQLSLKWHGFPTMWSFQMAFLLVFCACSMPKSHPFAPKMVQPAACEVLWRRVWAPWRKRSCASFRSPIARPEASWLGTGQQGGLILPSKVGILSIYPVVRRELRSYGYSYSLLNGELRSYQEFPNHILAMKKWI